MDPTNVGFLKWLDPYKKKEEHIQDSIKKENKKFMEKLEKGPALENLIERNKVYAEEGQPEWTLAYPIHDPKVLFQPPRLNYEYRWKMGSSWLEVDDLDFSKDGKIVAYTIASPSSHKNYKLSVRGAVRWTHPTYGGPFVAILGSRVFFIEGDKPLHYTRLISLDLHTGKDRRLIYEERDSAKELELVKCESRTLFLSTYDSGIQTLHDINEQGITQLSPKGVAFYPVGSNRGLPIYFVREGNLSSPWKLVGAPWKLNSRICTDGIEFCSAAAGILITKFYGVRTIWSLGGYPVKVYSEIFEVVPFMKMIGWLYGICDKIRCIRPGSSPYVINIKKGTIQSPKITYGGGLTSGISISSDRLPVRWALLKPTGNPIGLVCITYGAYGVATTLNTTRWRMWIDAGWAISLLFIRGGGDGNEMWADLGRLEGKKREIDDAEACIRDLQSITRCKPKNTVLFGRSAGGLVIGNIAARNPNGELVGIIYAEVPYVDLLKTAANPNLPLTEYEYREFGNPRAGLADFESALELSPIHQLGPKGAPGIKVLCRSGSDDIQVYPYESLKWIEALRGGKKDDTKLLYIDNGGHTSDNKFKQHVEDFAIIDALKYE